MGKILNAVGAGEVSIWGFTLLTRGGAVANTLSRGQDFSTHGWMLRMIISMEMVLTVLGKEVTAGRPVGEPGG